MYGDMAGTIYGDTRYVVGCTAKASEYPKYAELFTSIMGSVQLDAKYAPFATGYYRDFLSDEKVIIPDARPGTRNAGDAPWWYKYKP